MASYRITSRARANLIGIFDYTEANFGAYQAEAYYAGLIRSFGLLADFPAIGQRADELREGLRRFRFQAHIIFYTVEDDTVEIRGVLHHARNIRPGLFT
ncbi:type II toxin-antitoxin system RelE/ParE family toxin [Bradyrhizobium sp. STM 3557]|uniref:type II toxin-antitoxin system RelE/ParE family toxin n=1 Tax=Bradyrhizobium sp. STM 3557 TaxID=578920 RepID=UPI00388ECFE7